MKVGAQCCIYIYGDCLWLEVTSTLFFFKLLYRLPDKLEGFIGQIWNLLENYGSPASFAISDSHFQYCFSGGDY